MTNITLLDGSIGQEIVKRSGSRATPLWSTSVMMEQPEAVRAVHLDYFNAGATIATTNTYAVHVDRLARVGLEAQHKTLLDIAMAEAVAARTAHGSGRIAASLGPLGASYRPDIAPPLAEAQKAYASIVEALDPLADLFLIETVSSLHDARGALMGCAATEKPVWLAVTVDDDDGTKLRSGESVSDLAQIVSEFAPAALLVNCSRPEAIAAALNLIAPMGLPFGAYANGFTRISEGFPQRRANRRRIGATQGSWPQRLCRLRHALDRPRGNHRGRLLRSRPRTHHRARQSTQSRRPHNHLDFFFPKVSRGCGGWPPPLRQAKPHHPWSHPNAHSPLKSPRRYHWRRHRRLLRRLSLNKTWLERRGPA